MIITLACALAAFATYWICDYVVEGFSDSNTMALLITDAGVKSDDKKLQGQLTSATIALKTCRDLGLALCIGCLGGGGGGLPTLPPSKRLLGQAKGVK